jgi:hypothetical protein
MTCKVRLKYRLRGLKKAARQLFWYPGPFTARAQDILYGATILICFGYFVSCYRLDLFYLITTLRIVRVT